MIILLIVLGAVVVYFMCLGLIALVGLISIMVKAALIVRAERKAEQRGLHAVETGSLEVPPVETPRLTWEERVRADTARMKAERAEKKAARRARRGRRSSKAGA